MSAVDVALPVEVPGEDVLNAPHPPVAAGVVIAFHNIADHPRGGVGSSAEFGGPLRHDGWTPAVPTWDDLTTAEHDDHRQVCPDGCALCEESRSWGLCPPCGRSNAEAAADGNSLCCGARVLFGAEADRAWVS